MLTSPITSTARRLLLVNRKTCKGCVYYRPLATHGDKFISYCNYMLDTGQKRNCSPEQCDKYTAQSTTKKHKRKKVSNCKIL
nr:MAG TPA: hypothetical protein [Caudoviricetes sp.]